MNNWSLTTIRLQAMQRHGTSCEAIGLMLWAMCRSDDYVHRKKTAMREVGLTDWQWRKVVDELAQLGCYEAKTYTNNKGRHVTLMHFSWGQLEGIHRPDQRFEVIDVDDK